MAFAASGGFLRLSALLAESLPGRDGWFLPEAAADTWSTAQMGKEGTMVETGDCVIMARVP